MNEQEGTLAGRSAIVISVSSDIGTALARRWRGRGWAVRGTFRTPSPELDELRALGIELVGCDLSDPPSIAGACAALRADGRRWDVLVLCAGTLEPLGAFADVPFEDWEASVAVNFTAQLRLVHGLLDARDRGPGPGPCVLFFAGGGTNGATRHCSAYTVSKIALIKMCELLDAEIPDTRFAIVGPGWVRTKIHEEVLRAPEKAGPNYARTLERMADKDGWTAMDTVLDCCDWLVSAPRGQVGGRNFSAASDRWGTVELGAALEARPDLYKLRRWGNRWAPTPTHQRRTKGSRP